MHIGFVDPRATRDHLRPVTTLGVDEVEDTSATGGRMMRSVIGITRTLPLCRVGLLIAKAAERLNDGGRTNGQLLPVIPTRRIPQNHQIAVLIKPPC